MKVSDALPIDPALLAARAARDPAIARDPAVAGEQAPAAGEPEATRKGDTVELSDAGRARALSEALSTERVDELRRKAADGTYLTTEVADAVAREILRRGDA